MQRKGFSIIELLVAISFVSAIILLILTLGSFNSRILKYNEDRTTAVFYASEAIEALKMFSWDELIVNNNHSITFNTDHWELGAGDQLLAGRYTRAINVASVNRESSSNGQVYGAMVSSGGYLDPDTKKITVTMTWNLLGNSQTEEIVTYFHRWQAGRWKQTDWEGGAGQINWSSVNKFFSSDSGIDVSIPGVVTLQAGFLDWSQATTTATFDSPGNFDDNDVYEVDGIAYLVTEDNPQGSEFYVLDVSDIYNPWQKASLNIGSAVSSVVVSGEYAYIATADNYAEFKVVSIADKNNPQVVAALDLPGNDDALDVAVDNTEAYIIQGSNLYSFSILDPTNPQPLDNISVDELAIEISLSGDYIYLATQNPDGELQIVEVTNPANLGVAGQYSLPGNLKGTDIFVRGNRAFISTQNNGDGDEFFVLEVSDPANIVFLGSYGVDESVYSIAIIGPYALVGTNLLNDELIVLDVSFPETINLVSGFDLTGYVLGMSANCSVIYAATSGNQGEFFIISTEVFDCDYADAGILESSTFDTGSSQVSYNWIAWTASEPSQTDIKFKIATSDNIDGPWNFVGPDGTSATYYNTAAQEFINYTYHLNQRYLRYQLFLDSQSAWQIPILEDITISYSTW
ncbi:MAG: hypothetical protein Q8O32_00740 [bacterium]|nr:hypothetical protein [bacterium]